MWYCFIFRCAPSCIPLVCPNLVHCCSQCILWGNMLTAGWYWYWLRFEVLAVVLLWMWDFVIGETVPAFQRTVYASPSGSNRQSREYLCGLPDLMKAWWWFKISANWWLNNSASHLRRVESANIHIFLMCKLFTGEDIMQGTSYSETGDCTSAHYIS
jgi:hypothetical protein